MGLLDILTQGGTPLSITFYGSDPSPLPGSLQSSLLHAGMAGNDPGYSLNGNYSQDITTAANSYNTGVGGNGLPGFPSFLDLNGDQPGTYRDNAPEGSTGHF